MKTTTQTIRFAYASKILSDAGSLSIQTLRARVVPRSAAENLPPGMIEIMGELERNWKTGAIVIAKTKTRRSWYLPSGDHYIRAHVQDLEAREHVLAGFTRIKPESIAAFVADFAPVPEVTA